MFVINNYDLVYDHDREMHIVKSKQAPLCPDCGALMSGYCSQRRKVIGSDGNSLILLVRRLKCPMCNHMHSELPDIIVPNKHYSSDTIRRVRSGDASICPADDSTMRRWRKDSSKQKDPSMLTID